MRLVATLIFFSVLCVASRAQAGDPRRMYRSLECPHFVVSFDAPLEPIARRACVVAERAHTVLVPTFGHAPPEKTQIVVTDETDSANGFALVVPRNAIRVFATAPDGDSSLNDHDDWLYSLIVHEYAHVLHIDTVSGIPALYNRIFGKVWTPNQNVPRWVTEGIAVFAETRWSSGGRARATIFDGILRMMLLEGKEIDLSSMSHVPRAWPHGNVPYLFGGVFFDWIARRYGDQAIRTFSHDYGRNPIPWDLGRSIRIGTGRNFDELHTEWMTHLRARAHLQRDRILGSGLRTGRRLTFTGEGNGSPDFRPDGRAVWWFESDGRSPSGFRELLRAPGGHHSVSHLGRVPGTANMAPLLDGSGAVLQVRMPYRTYSSYDDLFVVTWNSGKLRRLTRGERAQSPALSPSGRDIAYVRNSGMGSTLRVMPIDGGESRELWQPDRPWDEVFDPEWSPDGRSVAFVVRGQAGFRDLLELDLATRVVRRLTHDRAIEGAPEYSSDGTWLYFTSDRSGIFNVYALERTTGRVFQVTNVLGGAFEPALSPDGSRLVYRGLTSKGNDIFEIALDPATFTPAAPYIDDRPSAELIGDDESPITASRPYRALETLAPRSWDGTFSTGTFGSSARVTVNGSDVVGLHSYALAVIAGGDPKGVHAVASYAYERLWPSLRFSAGRNARRPGGLVLDGVNNTYPEEVWSTSAQISLPLYRAPITRIDASFAWDADVLRYLGDPIVASPDMQVPSMPETGLVSGLTARLSFSNVESLTYASGPYRGRTLSMGVRGNHPFIGSDFKTLALSWGWDEYVPVPIGIHVLSLRLQGGYERTTRLRDGQFSLGAVPGQDVWDAIVNSTRVGSSGILRGYAPGTFRGRQYHLLNAEYRMPFVDVDRGFSTVPAFVRRLHGALLLDAAIVADESFGARRTALSLGAALRLDTTFRFGEAGTFELGAQRGVTSEGELQVWFLLTRGI